MFEDTLLESSVEAAPVLKGIHWLISIGHWRGRLPGWVFYTAHGLGKRDEGDCDPVGDCGVW